MISSNHLVLVSRVSAARVLPLVLLRPLAVLAGVLVAGVASVAGSHVGFRGRSDRGRDRFLLRRVGLRHRGLGGLHQFLRAGIHTLHTWRTRLRSITGVSTLSVLEKSKRKSNAYLDDVLVIAPLGDASVRPRCVFLAALLVALLTAFPLRLVLARLEARVRIRQLHSNRLVIRAQDVIDLAEDVVHEAIVLRHVDRRHVAARLGLHAT